MDTAAGAARAEMQVPIQVALPVGKQTRQLEIRPYMLQETLDIFGVGNRVEGEDYAMFWSKKHGAKFYLPGGVIAPPKVKPNHTVDLTVMGGVPYFVDKGGGAFDTN